MVKIHEDYIDFTTNLGNYYGNVSFGQYGNAYYMILENHDAFNGIEISEKFYHEAIKEFNKPKPEVRICAVNGQVHLPDGFTDQYNVIWVDINGEKMI